MRAVKAVGKTVKWLILAGAALIIIVVVVAIFSLGSAADKSEKSSRQVNPTQFVALKIGTPISRVRSMFGKPEKTDTTEVTGFKQTCWYYGILAQNGSYQICFEKGRVAVKNTY